IGLSDGSHGRSSNFILIGVKEPGSWGVKIEFGTNGFPPDVEIKSRLHSEKQQSSTLGNVRGLPVITFRDVQPALPVFKPPSTVQICYADYNPAAANKKI
nr:hypothetical protein [Tanacetum cinerariifolium]